MEPRPDLRKRLDYSPGAQLWAPPGVREQVQRQEARRQLMDVVCPRCGYQSGSPRKYAIVMCMADEAPFTGENRGCGWMLAAEPPFYPANRRAKVHAVIDCKIDRATGFSPGDKVVQMHPVMRVVPGLLRRKGYQMIREDWERRGLVKIERDEDGTPVRASFVATANAGPALGTN